MILAFLFAAHADCTAADLEEVLTLTETAFASMSDQFDTMGARLEKATKCLREPLTPPLAARVHRAHALVAFYNGDDTRTLEAFGRYRVLRPRGVLPESLAPLEHPLRTLFDEAPPASGLRGLGKPPVGWLLVDGEHATEAPTALPHFLQHIDDAGVPLFTKRVFPKDTLPDFPATEPDLIEREPDKARIVVGSALVGLGATGYGIAFATRGDYRDAVANGERDRIKSKHQMTNGLAGAGLGLIAIGGGLAISGVL